HQRFDTTQAAMFAVAHAEARNRHAVLVPLENLPDRSNGCRYRIVMVVVVGDLGLRAFHSARTVS
ncbi:MAG TPA: hypothetical protein VGP33_08475, partial [Chloroflexota bacterium]|nr:hypothetical protein [Chloroflexota bacterium]